MGGWIVADVKTEEIKTLGEMADVGFGCGPAQPTWCEPLGQERLGHHGLSVRRTKDCHIIGVAYERVCAAERAAGGVITPQRLFHTVESDIQQQRADHPTLGDPSVGGMPHVLFHVASFEPLFDQLPCWEITNGLA